MKKYWRILCFSAFAALLIGMLQQLTGAGIPYYEEKEQETDAFVNPRRITISGYQGSAMEPFISPDGKFLFFNSDDDNDNHSKALYFAERTGPLEFRFLGELPGTGELAAHSVTAAPSMDRQGRFYFTSMRQYDKDMRATFIGDFDGREVTHIHAVEGDMNPSGPPGTVNMDVSASPDGKTLYISRARFGILLHRIRESDLMIAHENAGIFTIDPRSPQIMKNINTQALEYAPDISADGRELYFTRTSRPGGMRILVASRTSENEPFGKPCALNAAQGLVEAPSLSLDGKELFFHKKQDKGWAIFRAERNPKAQNIRCGIK